MAGTSQLVWHAGGFVGRASGQLRRYMADGSQTTLGEHPGRQVSAAVGNDRWLTDRRTLWLHDQGGTQRLALDLGAPLLGVLSLSPSGRVVAARLIRQGGGSSALRLLSRAGETLLE